MTFSSKLSSNEAKSAVPITCLCHSFDQMMTGAASQSLYNIFEKFDWKNVFLEINAVFQFIKCKDTLSTAMITNY